MRAGARLLACALAALLSSAAPAAAESERIETFDSRIQVHADGSMTVTETITVTAAGEEIRRGIYRAFPTTYRDRFGNRVRVAFEVLEVLRDGRPEPWHVRRASNGSRVYIGEEDVLLRPGRYTYAITYRTDRQLGFFDGFDELYWNVTGNDWAFPIARARAVIRLPKGAPVLEAAGWTGPQGARGQDFTLGHDAAGTVIAATTRPLAPGEGLTVAVSWPKGYVTEPTAADRMRFLLVDNAALVMALVGFAVVLAYYLFAWSWVGRDPRSGAIIPRFAPPAGLSPAAVRYILKMGYSEKALAAAIVSMAVKGYLAIEEDADGTYTLRQTGRDGGQLSRGERHVAERLLDGASRIELDDKNHRRIGAAVRALKESLADDFAALHFRRNLVWFVAGLAATLTAVAAAVINAPDPAEAGVMGVWLTVWSVVCYLLVRRVLVAWRGRRVRAVVGSALFAVPFLVGEIFGLVGLAGALGLAAAAVLALIALTNALFYDLLKAPTVAGRRVMDEIEGFKMYLEVAEKDRLGVLNPPDRTPALFEKYLPYALALDVEHQWSAQFADVLAAAGVSADGGGYRPGWYRGRAWDGGSTGFARSLGGSFSGAIAAASSPPGSSSGSGGGSSGGGGGGGGGGGW